MSTTAAPSCDGAPTACGACPRPPARLLGDVRDVLLDIAQTARASGAALAATHIQAAGVSTAAARRLLPDVVPCGGDADDVERITLWNGDAVAAVLRRRGDALAGWNVPLDGIAPHPPAIAAHDLGWDLQGSASARALAADQTSAALLARTLAQTCWVAPARRSRWSTSMAGAVTLVRLLRDGRAFPILDASGSLFHDESLAVAGSLGWRPAHTRR